MFNVVAFQYSPCLTPCTLQNRCNFDFGKLNYNNGIIKFEDFLPIAFWVKQVLKIG